MNRIIFILTLSAFLFSQTAEITIGVMGSSIDGLSISPMSLDFGEVRLGESADLDVEFCNTGDEELNVNLTPSDQLSISLTAFVIYSGNCVSNTATYTPTEEGEFTGTLNIQSNDASDPNFDMEVTGIGIAEPIINVTPDFLHFDVVVFDDTLATQTLTITNDGFADLTWEIMDGEDVFGNGSDGELYIQSGETFNIDEVRTVVIGDNFSGSSIITVSNTEGLNTGDEVLIISMQDPNENLDENVTGT